ncbi:MAG: cupin domain-containing protein [Planctomycetota bacterium]|jgi:quercetin dioxygenase-like cupin family protein
MKTDYRIDFQSMPWEIPAVGVRFKAYQQDGRKLRVAEFDKEFIEPDWCTKGHIAYILDGRCQIDFNGNVIAFGAGDGIFIPIGQAHKHKIKILTEKLKLIIVEDEQ